MECPKCGSYNDYNGISCKRCGYEREKIVKLNKGDIFVIDVHTFLREEMYKDPIFKVLTKEEIIKEHMYIPNEYGWLMIKME